MSLFLTVLGTRKISVKSVNNKKNNSKGFDETKRSIKSEFRVVKPGRNLIDDGSSEDCE